VDLRICTGKPDCASAEEIESYFYPKLKKVMFVYTNSGISSEKADIDHPVFYYADDKLFNYINTQVQ
jgi:hypothetical protein